MPTKLNVAAIEENILIVSYHFSPNPEALGNVDGQHVRLSAVRGLASIKLFVITLAELFETFRPYPAHTFEELASTWKTNSLHLTIVSLRFILVRAILVRPRDRHVPGERKKKDQ